MISQSHQKEDKRLQAVLALLQGERVVHVVDEFNISRSCLYKFKKRALLAMRDALKDHPHGAKRKELTEQDKKIISMCKRYPALSSYEIQKRVSDTNPRKIQRIRKKYGLPRVSKRAPTVVPAKRLSQETVNRAIEVIKQKPHLGGERIAWDLQNGEHRQISSSSIKRLKSSLNPKEPKKEWKFYERKHPHDLWHGDFMQKVSLTNILPTEYAWQLALLDDYSRGYVFCDLFITPDVRDVIRGIITAIRKWRVIPKAIIFDNGSQFVGMLLKAFCKNLDIRLTHTSVMHPQTNGKLERAFRDDMKDFYKLYKEWHIEELRRDLPNYVYYRNHIRGHKALSGKPSITRLNENNRFADPDTMDRLENLARYEVKSRVIPQNGYIRMFGRTVYVGQDYAGVEVALCETLEGLEARVEDQCIGILENYRDMRQMHSWEWNKLPTSLCFTPKNEICPRITVA